MKKNLDKTNEHVTANFEQLYEMYNVDPASFKKEELYDFTLRAFFVAFTAYDRWMETNNMMYAYMGNFAYEFILKVKDYDNEVLINILGKTVLSSIIDTECETFSIYSMTQDHNKTIEKRFTIMPYLKNVFQNLNL